MSSKEPTTPPAKATTVESSTKTPTSSTLSAQEMEDIEVRQIKESLKRLDERLKRMGG